MAVAISATERDALYAFIVYSLPGDLSDLVRAERAGRWEDCYRIGRRVTNGLRLIQDAGLGWGWVAEGGDTEIELTLSEDQLQSVFADLTKEAILPRENERGEFEEQAQDWERIQLAAQACVNVQKQIRGESS